MPNDVYTTKQRELIHGMQEAFGTKPQNNNPELDAAHPAPTNLMLDRSRQMQNLFQQRNAIQQNEIAAEDQPAANEMLAKINAQIDALSKQDQVEKQPQYFQGLKSKFQP